MGGFSPIHLLVLAIVAILVGHIWVMLLVLGLAGAQAALFGPAKLGSIPEMVDESRISAANGLIGLTTVFSTMVGTYAGSWLADFTGDKGQAHWQWSAVVLLGVAGCERAAPPRAPPAPALSGELVLGEVVRGATPADPLPQALVLTAIVISFGTTAFLVALALRAIGESGTDHVDGGREEER